MTMSLSGARPTDADSPGRPTTRVANGPVSKVSFAGATAAASGTVCRARVSLAEAAWGGCQAGMIEVASVSASDSPCVPLSGAAVPGPPGHAITVETIGTVCGAGACRAGSGSTGTAMGGTVGATCASGAGSQVGAGAATGAGDDSQVGSAVAGADGGSSQVGTCVAAAGGSSHVGAGDGAGGAASAQVGISGAAGAEGSACGSTAG